MSHWYQSQEPQHLTPYLSASSNQLHTSRLTSSGALLWSHLSRIGQQLQGLMERTPSAVLEVPSNG